MLVISSSTSGNSLRPDFRLVEDILQSIFGFGRTLKKFIARELLTRPITKDTIYEILSKAKNKPEFSKEFEVKRSSPASFMMLSKQVQKEIEDSLPLVLENISKKTGIPISDLLSKVKNNGSN